MGQEASAHETQPSALPPSAAGRTITSLAVVSVLTSVLGLGLSIARSKVTAVVLGPEGLGRAAAILQIVSTVFVPLSVVTGPPLLAALARARDDRPAQQRVLDTAGTVILLGGLVLALASAVAAPFLLPNQGAFVWAYALLGAAAAVAIPLCGLPTQVLLAQGDVTQQAKLGLLYSFVSGLLLVGATWTFKLPGQFVAAAIAPPLVLFALLPVWHRLLPGLRLRPRLRFDRAFLKESLAIGTTTLVAGFTMQGALTIIRLLLERHGGDEANGQFQAAYSIGATYFGVVLQGLGNVVFPRYAAAHDTRALTEETDEASRFVFRTAPAVILIAIALRTPAMHALYSSRFDAAARMVGYQMAGDLAKALSWAQAGPLLYRGRVRAYVVTELCCALALVGCSVVLVPHLGPLGASVGYALAYVLYALVTAVVLERSCGVPVRWRRLAVTVGFTAAAMALVWGGERSGWVQGATFAAGCVWLWRSGLVALVLGKVRRKLGLKARATVDLPPAT